MPRAGVLPNVGARSVAARATAATGCAALQKGLRDYGTTASGAAVLCARQLTFIASTVPCIVVAQDLRQNRASSPSSLNAGHRAVRQRMGDCIDGDLLAG